MRRLLLLCACALPALPALPALAGLAGGDVVQAGAGGAGGAAGAAGAAGAGGAGAAWFPAARTRVAAAAGTAAELRCAVRHLGDKVVSWVRTRDLQILSHAGVVFTGDARVTAAVAPSDPSEYGDASDVTVHALRIAGLRASDAGRYECQVNTEPKMSLMFDLLVVDEEVPHIQVWALGPGSVTAPAGAAATLACEARWAPPPRQVPAPPLRLRWLRADREMAGAGGVSVEADRGPARAVSRLTLAAVAGPDAGPYRCEAGARGHSSRGVTLHLRVLEDSGGGEMLGDEAAAQAHAGRAPVTSSAPATVMLLLLAALRWQL